MDANMKKYEDNKLMKMIRKLKGIIYKSQGVLDIDLTEYKNIDPRLKSSFHKYLNLLEKECKKIELDEKYFYDGILHDLDIEAFKIYLASPNEKVLNYSSFFKENPYAKMYFMVKTGEIYINEQHVLINNTIDEMETIKVISHAFEHYLHHRFKDKDQKKESYPWLEEGITQIASKKIIDSDDLQYNNYVTYIKSAFRYRMLSGKNFDENKVFAEHKLGRNSYLHNILNRDFCKNIESVIESRKKDSNIFTDKEFAEVVEDIYLKYILDINKSKIRNIQKYDFSAEYKRYYTIIKNLNVNGKNTDSKILNRILEDLTVYFMKHTENQVEAIKEFLNLLNTDIIYKSEFETPEKKLDLLIQILKMKSKYGENVNEQLEKAIEKYEDVSVYKKGAFLEVEPLTGRFQATILKEKVKEKIRIKIDKGDILYNSNYFITKDNNKYDKITFLYDGTIKKDLSNDTLKIKKSNMQDELEKREYERLLKLTLTEYKRDKKEINKKYKESLEAFNSYYKRYMLKYIPSSDYTLEQINNVLDKNEYKAKDDEQVNTVIMKYFSKIAEAEFLEDEEVNVRNMVNTFVKSDKVFRES